MATLAELQDRLERLDKAIHSGIQTVSYADGRQTYRDHEQMLAARREIQRQIDEINNTKRRKVIRLNADKGL